VEITLQLTDETIRKVRALNILMGGIDNIDVLLASLVDKAVVNALVEKVLGTEAAAQQAASRETPTQRAQQPVQVPYTDLTGISDGLGDLEPEVPRRRRRTRKSENAPQAAPTSDAVLAQDMTVGDPDHEAKVEAPTFADQMGGEVMPTAEEAFGLAADMDPPQRVAEPAPERRRARINPQRVTAFTGGESHTI